MTAAATPPEKTLILIQERADKIPSEFRNILTDALRQGFEKKGMPNWESVEPRPFQLIVNDLMLNQGKNVLHVVATSQGKTETFLIGCREWRSRKGAGPIIVFSPLNALIRDQLKRVNEFGLKAYVFGGVNVFGKGHQTQTIKALKKNEVDVLYLTPDMVLYAHNNQGHDLNKVLQLRDDYRPHRKDTWTNVPLLVIDEIHVIKEAGVGYLDSWKRVWNTLNRCPWFLNSRKLGLTATLTDDTYELIQEYTRINWELERGPLFRKNIRISVIPGYHSRASRADWICEYISDKESRSPLLIFVQKKIDCSFYCKKINEILSLNGRGNGAEVYHADLPADERKNVEDRFRNGTTRFLVATKALGLGFDKSDIRTVIHAYTPPSVSQWYQEFGRAGRDEHSAHAVLLPTVPWGVNQDINDLIPVLRYLNSCGKKTSRENVEGFLSGRDTPDKRIEELLLCGEKEKLFSVSDEEVELNPSPESKTRLDVLIAVASRGSEELKFLKDFRNAQENCIWRQLLSRLLDPSVVDGWTCGKCSAKSCKGSYNKIRYDEFAGSNFLYRKIVGSTNTPVLCLHEPEDALDFDPHRLEAIAEKFLDHYGTVPAEWVVGCIPNQDGRVRKQAEELASALNLDFCDFIMRDSRCTLSMKTAKTDEERQKAVAKYSLDAEKIPLCRRVLLFDDVLNTGTTMDHVVKLIKNVYPSLEITGLVEKFYGADSVEQLSLKEPEDVEMLD